MYIRTHIGMHIRNRIILAKYSATQIFNQVHAGLWPAYAWFLEITFMQQVCVCVHLLGHK